MTNPKLLLPGLIVALFSTSGAQAQVTIDISKVTCEQFVQYQITMTRTSPFGYTATITASAATPSSSPKSLR
jgi:hypothetical protein